MTLRGPGACHDDALSDRAPVALVRNGGERDTPWRRPVDAAVALAVFP
jgi:hypothetical protein